MPRVLRRLFGNGQPQGSFRSCSGYGTKFCGGSLEPRSDFAGKYLECVSCGKQYNS